MHYVKKYYLNFFIFLFILFVSFIIALQLPAYNWETDYGHHYYVSMFNGDKANLYQDFQIHKGPVSFVILDILGIVIDYGWKQSIFSYFFTISLFFFTITYFIKYESKNILFFFISLIFFLTFFRNQGSNIFSDINLNIFLFLSFIFFIKFIDGLNKNNIYFFTLFFTLAILCRIDSIFYFIPFCLVFIIFLIKEDKLKILNFKFITINLFLIIIIFFLLFLIYNFNFKDFISSNIYFNLEYSKDFAKFKNISYLYHLTPNKILSLILLIKLFFYLKENFEVNKIFKYCLLLITILQIIFYLFKFEEFLLFNLLYLLEIGILLYIFSINKNYKNYRLLIALVLKYTSIFIYLYSGSFKLHHAFILLFGFSIYSIFFIKFIFNTKIKFKKIIIFVVIILSIDQSIKVYSSLKRPLLRNDNVQFNNGIHNFFYNNDLVKFSLLSNFILQNNSAVICDRAWPHIFNKKQSNGFMFDWWFYDKNKKSLNTNFIKSFHNDILNKKYGNFVLIDNDCVSGSIFSNNYLIKELIQRSNKISNINFFENSYDIREINE